MNNKKHDLLLADDDEDDCTFFKEALEEFPVATRLMTVNDGVKLMNFLSNPSNKLPEVLFLDLNMPRKSGFECLLEIKMNENLKDLPIIIFSTSLDLAIIDLLYEKGANYYIQKPGQFSKLKKVIFDALNLIGQGRYKQPARDEFILEP